jgi:hypothetical protein
VLARAVFIDANGRILMRKKLAGYPSQLRWFVIKGWTFGHQRTNSNHPMLGLRLLSLYGLCE